VFSLPYSAEKNLRPERCEMKMNPFKNGRMSGSDTAVESGADGEQVDRFEVEFQKLKTRIHRELIDSLDLSRISSLDEPRLCVHIRNLAEGMLRSRPEMLSVIDEERLIEELMAESFGLGPLEPYMQDPDVTDILVNGPNEVYVERLGRLQETNTVFADEEHLMQIIQRVVARVGRRIDEQSPMVDARLPDGSRVNAIIPPLALNGPVLSVRRFGHEPLKLKDLLAFGSICPDMVTLLKAVVEGRINIMISGGTGAGKTTLLNGLSKFVPDDERLVTVEDSAELKLQRKHVVSLETRIPNLEDHGQVTPRDLVRNALRMRPDRIILGEVRGAEALDMLQAMNTGHEGSLTTIHANDTRDALSRLEVMVSMAGFELPVGVVRQYIGSAITLVVHLARLKGGVRRVTRISEIVGLDGDDYQMREIFGFRQAGVDDAGRAKGSFYASGNVPRFAARLKERGIELPEDLFSQREVVAGQASESSCQEVLT
jgi:pilus assembly protein CpaF